MLGRRNKAPCRPRNSRVGEEGVRREGGETGEAVGAGSLVAHPHHENTWILSFGF